VKNFRSPRKERQLLKPNTVPEGSGASLLGVLVIAILFIALAFAAHTTPYFDFDLAFARAVQSIQAPWFGAAMSLVGLPGYPPQVYVEMTALILGLWFMGARWEAICVLFANLVVGTAGTGVKLLVARMRPSPGLIRVANPSLDGGGLSFPAGHVLVYVMVLGFLMYLLWCVPQRKWWQNALLLFMGVIIALIGVARVYSGEHWLSDVVGGYFFGVIGLWVTIMLYRWGKDRFFTKESRLAPSQPI